MVAMKLAAVGLLSLVPLARGGYMDLVSLKDRHPDAVCLDGTPSGYHLRLADDTDAGKRTWIVYLESGGWCWDRQSCDERCVKRPELCTSTVWPESIDVGGLLSRTNEDLHISLRTANKVFVRYCSSDAHMGDATAFGGLQFRGHKVIQAVLSDLVKEHGLGKGGPADRDLLLFGGGSAGARGAMVHLDYVSEMLGSAATGVDVVGFLDSPLWLDMPPFNLSDPELWYLSEQTATIHSFAQVSHLGPDCVAAFPNDQWKCMLGEYRLPFLTTRYVVGAALHDAFGLWALLGGQPSEWSAAELEFVVAFANRTASVLEHIASNGHAVIGMSCYTHSESLHDAGFFKKTTNGGKTLSYALHHLLGLVEGTNGAISVIKYIDDCRTLGCGVGCEPDDDEESPDGTHELDTTPGKTIAISAMLLAVVGAMSA